MNTVQKGRIGLSMAINYFTLKGYTILLPLNDTQNYDLAVEKDEIIKTVQCKTTWEKSKTNPNDGYVLSLRTVGGTKGTVYYNITDTNVDYLFAYRGDGIMYLIPVDDLKGKCKTSITLVSYRSKKSSPKIETEKYIVH